MALNAEALIELDSQLNNDAFKALHAKYSKLASDESLSRTQQGLESKGHKVSIVDTGSDALSLITSLIPEGSSVHNTGSTSLVRFQSTSPAPSLLFLTYRLKHLKQFDSPR